MLSIDNILSMTEQFPLKATAYKLDPEAMRQLKEGGLIPHATLQTQAIFRCIGCPLARDEQFDTTRAQACTGFPYKTVSAIVRRFARNGVLEDPTPQASETGGAPRILFRVNKQVKGILDGTKPLPWCIKEE